MKRTRAIGSVVLVLTLSAASAVGCTVNAGSDDAASASQDVTAKVKGVTKADRENYLASARIWSESEFAKLDQKDLLTGPGGPGSFQAKRQADGSAAFPEITCEFVEPQRPHELGGRSPKFQCGQQCKTPGKDCSSVLKVKFGNTADSNGEIYAELMATRLLWALGFKTDDDYAVRVTCKNCPEDPWKVYDEFTPGQGARADRHYQAALIERKNDGAKIEEDSWPANGDSQGFAFDEVEKLRANKKNAPGAASDAEWSAFKLLVAFIRHADSKSANQRLVCPPEAIKADKTCSAPYLMIQDMGSTFGRGGLFGIGTIGADSKARWNQWNAGFLWSDVDRCKAALASVFYRDPVASEDGRKLLVNILSKITDKHLRDLFAASRVVERGETLVENGQSRQVTVEDWIKLFDKKRNDLSSHRCGG